MSTQSLRVLQAFLLASLCGVALAGHAIPHGALIAKSVGAGFLLSAAPELLARGVPPESMRGLVLPTGGFAMVCVASLVWTVDADATGFRARHLVMEVLFLVTLAAVWRPQTARALGLGGALAAGVIAAGFLTEWAIPDGVRLRPFGVHPNLAARDAVLGALLGTLLVPRLPRWATVTIGAVGGFALGLSNSSGAMLAAVAACAVLALTARWRPLVVSLLLGTLFGGALLVVSADRAPQLRSAATAVRGSAIEEIGSGRLVLWGHAVRVARQHPLLGAGAGAFPAAMEPIRVKHQLAGGEHSKPRRRAHNSFLEVLAETGPAGLLLFCLPLAWATHRGVRRRHLPALALVAFVITSAATDSLLQQRSLWLAIGVAVLMTGRAGLRATAPRSPPPTS